MRGIWRTVLDFVGRLLDSDVPPRGDLHSMSDVAAFVFSDGAVGLRSRFGSGLVEARPTMRATPFI
jgi:hypothetical protein